MNRKQPRIPQASAMGVCQPPDSEQKEYARLGGLLQLQKVCWNEAVRQNGDAAKIAHTWVLWARSKNLKGVPSRAVERGKCLFLLGGFLVPRIGNANPAKNGISRRGMYVA